MTDVIKAVKRERGRDGRGSLRLPFRLLRLRDQLFDLAQPILSKEDFVADIEGRRTKCSALH